MWPVSESAKSMNSLPVPDFSMKLPKSTKTITLASRSYSVPRGDRAIRTVRLGRANRKLVRKYRIKRGTLTLTQTVGGITKTTKTSVPVRLFGIPKRFLDHASRGQVLAHYSPVRHCPVPSTPKRFKNRTVRLACVKHAASVRPEPGSNSRLSSYLRFQISSGLAEPGGSSSEPAQPHRCAGRGSSPLAGLAPCVASLKYFRCSL